MDPSAIFDYNNVGRTKLYYVRYCAFVNTFSEDVCLT